MRGKLDTDTLLSLILVLAVVWLALDVVGELLAFLGPVFVVLPNLIGVLIILFIVLWWFDYI